MLCCFFDLKPQTQGAQMFFSSSANVYKVLLFPFTDVYGYSLLMSVNSDMASVKIRKQSVHRYCFRNIWQQKSSNVSLQYFQTVVNNQGSLKVGCYDLWLKFLIKDVKVGIWETRDFHQHNPSHRIPHLQSEWCSCSVLAWWPNRSPCLPSRALTVCAPHSSPSSSSTHFISRLAFRQKVAQKSVPASQVSQKSVPASQDFFQTLS